MSLILTEDELIELTGKRQRAKQCHELTVLRIPFHCRSDGFPVVYRASLPTAPTQAEAKRKARREPDFAAIGR